LKDIPNILLPILLGLLALASQLSAQKEESFAHKLWDLPQVYEDEANPYIQEFEFVGYVQHQVGFVDSNKGHFQDSEFRRFRLGMRARFLRDWYLFNLVDVNPLEGPFYENITLAYLTWSPFGNSVTDREKFQISGGKQKLYFTREFSQSPKIIKTIERSLLVNYHLPQFATGGWVSGEAGDYRYMAALFSGDREEEFSGFDHGGLFLMKFGRDFGEYWNVDLDMVFADDEQQIISGIDWGLSFSAEYNPKYSDGNFYFLSDFIATGGLNGQADTYGLILMPAWQLHNNLELVTRFQLASSSGRNGLRLQKRYERLAGDFRGENYTAGYAGLNYFLRGQQLKIMGGVEYATMDQGAFDGHTWLLGFRMFF
jgi:phosphate-selective porin OprO/OprP